MKSTAFGLLLLLPCLSFAQGKRLWLLELDTPPNMMGLGAQLARRR